MKGKIITWKQQCKSHRGLYTVEYTGKVMNELHHGVLLVRVQTVKVESNPSFSTHSYRRVNKSRVKEIEHAEKTD